MPVLVKEISEGGEFSRSLEPGSLSDSQTRVFRVIVAPGEYLDIQAACGIYIGNPHPQNTNIYCSSFSAKYEGKSRTVILCTFQYGVQAGGSGGDDTDDPQSKSPEDRTAKLTTSMVLFEVPVREWRPVVNDIAVAGLVPAQNPCNDIYDGVVKPVPGAQITFEQYEGTDPFRFIQYGGYVNDRPLQIATLECGRRTIMFRGVSRRPYTESWGGQLYRGYMASYEFLYRPDKWDLKIPQTGRNVFAFNPAAAAVDQDAYGVPLMHTNGKIAIPLALPTNVAAGQKVQAMVRVQEFDGGGVAQTVAGAPVPLNDDGTPRLGDVLVKQYSPNEEIDFAGTFGLRIA